MAFVIADRVKETSTTTGTGDFTLSGAMTGFVAFSAKCSTGDTLYYCIQGVDAFGIPTGEWECGLGTYSAANTLTRTAFTSSSTGSAVSFAAGTKQVYLTMPAVQVAWARERLTANRTYYVRTDGANTNTGLVDSAGGAFLTIQKAIDVIRSTLDIAAGVVVTVQIKDGTFTAANTVGGIVGKGTVVIQGNVTTPANVVISTTSSVAFTFSDAGAYTYTLKCLKMQTTTSGFGIFASNYSAINVDNVVFGACADGHMAVTTKSIVTITSNYAVSGGGAQHAIVVTGGRLECTGKTVTITGSPTLTYWLYLSSLSSAYLASNTYSGAVTGGTKYVVNQNSVCEGGGTLPGGTAGTTASGGQYL